MYYWLRVWWMKRIYLGRGLLTWREAANWIVETIANLV